jgi:predicted O-methyltransferase YrrM
VGVVEGGGVAGEVSFQAFADGFKFGQLADKTEVLLSADGSQIMMEWERPYMVRCIDALRIDSNSDVLEIGFGCGYSATRIQYWKPKSHTIVECAPEVLRKLRVWAADKPSVKIVEGTWQSQLASLGLFDAIFFDDFPLGNQENEVLFIHILLSSSSFTSCHVRS